MQHNFKNILLIDDDKDFLSDLSMILSEWFEVYEAEDSRQALRLLSESKPDFCITDIQLPPILNENKNLEGLYLANEILKTTGNKVKVILMSKQDLPLQNLPTSHLPFLKKPFQIDKLFGLIS